MFQEVFHGAISEAMDHFTAPRGEFTLVIEGFSGEASAKPEAAPSANDALRRLADLRAEGVVAQEAVARVAVEFGLPRNAVYRLWLKTRESGPE